MSDVKVVYKDTKLDKLEAASGYASMGKKCDICHNVLQHGEPIYFSVRAGSDLIIHKACFEKLEPTIPEGPMELEGDLLDAYLQGTTGGKPKL
jgi:hypothetical protein